MSVFTASFHADTAIDYNEAFYWYEEQQSGLGEKFLSAVNDKILEICVDPETFGVKFLTGYREAKVDNFPFSIVYRTYKKQKRVLISSIHHQKKHPRTKYRK